MTKQDALNKLDQMMKDAVVVADAIAANNLGIELIFIFANKENSQARSTNECTGAFAREAFRQIMQSGVSAPVLLDSDYTTSQKK